MTQAAFPRVSVNYAFTFGHVLSWAMAALGRLQPVEGMQCAGQASCKGLVTSNANDWSVAMQTGGQVECNSPHEPARSSQNSKKRRPMGRLKTTLIGAGASKGDCCFGRYAVIPKCESNGSDV